VGVAKNETAGARDLREQRQGEEKGDGEAGENSAASARHGGILSSRLQVQSSKFESGLLEP
jgi:hypothetical protein